MSLRAQANEDLKEILNDGDTGGVDCVITSPAGLTASFKVSHNDVHVAFDPGTGEMVTGRQASVAVITSELIAEGFDSIEGVADSSSAPWLATVSDVEGRSGVFKVAATHPDATLGLTVLILEFYEVA